MADRNCYLLATPKVTFLEEHMGDVVIPRINRQPLDSADVAVPSVDLLAPSDGDLIQGKCVIGDRLRHIANDSGQSVVRLGESLTGSVVRMAAAPRQELSLFGVLEFFKLCKGAGQLHSSGGCTTHEVEGDEATQTLSVFGLDDQIGDSSGDRIDNHLSDLTTKTIGTGCLDSDRELCRVRHGHLFLRPTFRRQPIHSISCPGPLCH